jgi:hypothetical protein
MARFGRRSQAVKASLHPMFHKPLDVAIQIVDFSLFEGARLEGKQNLLFKQGKTKVQFPDSAHNPLKLDDPVFAFDAMPYTVGYPGGTDWRTAKELFAAIDRNDEKEVKEILENIKRIRHTAGIIIGVFAAHDIPLINGADWDGDNIFDDQNFVDSPHFQHRNWRELRNGI